MTARGLVASRCSNISIAFWNDLTTTSGMAITDSSSFRRLQLDPGQPGESINGYVDDHVLIVGGNNIGEEKFQKKELSLQKLLHPVNGA